MISKNKAVQIQGYTFSPADRLFFDANIWLLLYAPQDSNDWRIKVYSKALVQAMVAKCPIYVDVLVISEYINRHTRLEHKLLYENGQAPQDFKTFRNSADFQPIAQTIAIAIRKIMKVSSRVESGFASFDIQTVLSEYESGRVDFNDQVITRLCHANKLKLVTHDADFRDCGLEILTANNRLIV